LTRCPCGPQRSTGESKLRLDRATAERALGAPVKETTMRQVLPTIASNRALYARATLLFAGAALLCVAALWLAPAAAQQKAAIPDFTQDSNSAWLMIGDELLPPPNGPGPVTFDKRYPYVDNGKARRTNSQPTYRVADLTNPILQPWAIEK
jgi:hypothetical protein